MSEEARRQEVMRLVLTHRTQLLAMLLALNRDPHRAEDLFQQTCLVVCAKWRDFTPGTSFLAWARTIARYEYLASIDPSRRREVAVAADVIAAALDAATHEQEDISAEREALGLCLETLEGRARQALDLRYSDGLACGTVARQLGMSAGALYVLLTRTRQALLACVERRLLAEVRHG